MNIKESKKQLRDLIEAWDLNEASLNQTDIDAIKNVLKELKLKDEEYKVLKVTSEMIEEELNQKICELESEIKALEGKEKENE